MQISDSNLSRTLEQLGELCLQDALETDTALVQECVALMRIPLGQMTTENLRMLIGQQIGLKHLMPIALKELALNPLAAGDFYAGDLLKAVIGASPAFWAAEPALRSALDEIISTLKERVCFLERDIFPAYQRIYAG